MISWLRTLSVRIWIGILTLAPILILVCLLFLAPPDGHERAQLLQFVGRFHPLSVHLPIALLLVVPIIEFAGRSRYFPYLLPAPDFLLWVAACGAVVAASLGWCLARSGGYSGPLVRQHMWAGLAAAAAALLCWVLRGQESATKLNRPYVTALIATVGLVSFTGHRGGQLSLGENNLTELMPEHLAALLRVSTPGDAPANSPNGGPSTFYGARIRPVFSQHCTTCHGRSRHKSNLRLDSYEAVMRGGKHGPVVKPGDVKGSELLRRISLPPSDDDAMPPDNRRPVSAGERRAIAQWVAAGASGTQSVESIKDVPVDFPAPVAAEVSFEEIDPATVAQRRASLASTVAHLQQRLPGIFDYQSRNSAEIVVHGAWMGTKFGDNDLATLAPLSDHIVWADLSSTAITDKSAPVIAAMKHLRTLRLMHTRITDATIRALGPLEQLESLNVFATPVTPAALPPLAHLPKLTRIYVGETKISAKSVPQEIEKKLVF